MTQTSSPSAAQRFFQKAEKSLSNQKFADAEANIAEAIAAEQTNSHYWGLLGKIWFQQDRLDEAKDATTMALQLNTQNDDALETMGNILLKQKNIIEGSAWLEKAYDIHKNNHVLAKKIAHHYYYQDKFSKAALYANEVIKLKGGDDEMKIFMATSLYQMGDRTSALDIFAESIFKDPNNINIKSSLVHCYQFYRHTDFSENAHKIVLICLKTERLAHRLLSRPWASLLWTNPDFEPLRRFEDPDHSRDIDVLPCLQNEFLILGLERVHLVDMGIEKSLQHLRRDILLNWDFYKQYAWDLVPFLSVLGTLSWFNEFVFYQDSIEKDALKSLEADVLSWIGGGELSDEQVARLCLISSYKALLDVSDDIQNLKFSKKQLYEIRSLLKAQVKDPLRERDIGKTIPGFTNISDETSKAVREMYEGRPYPRWRTVGKLSHTEDMLRKGENLELLVAGCGTGHEPIQYVSSAPRLKITAIDLSIASMAYGKRMAEEFGITNIDFRHGDLMKVADLNKTFDVITSSGVLHHLKEPEKGLAPLVSILKPGGRMSISLYSQYARDIILNPASEYIAQKGYTKSEDDIREFRKDIMALPEEDPRRLCTSTSDFFSLSECTDLLFHVQEHRYTFPKIRDMIERHGLELHHVMVESDVRKYYLEAFPDDTQMLNWDHWDEIEKKYPQTFAGMYKTWFKHKGDTSVHPLDNHIKIGLL
jgi:SAM-dependent methyltransferase/Tfp pilus assembly protein PilF